MAAIGLAIGTSLTVSWAGASAKDDARSHYDRALSLVDDNQYAEAIVEFNRCYEIQPHYAVFYNIAQAHIALARPVEAVEALQRYLKEGGREIKPSRRSLVEKEIVKQNARIATLSIIVQPDGAAIRLDGNDIGTAPIKEPIRLGLGTHVVAATLAGYKMASQNIELAGEDKKTIEIELTSTSSAGDQAINGGLTDAPQSQKDPSPAPEQSGHNQSSLQPGPSTAATHARGSLSNSGSTMRTVGLIGAGTGVAVLAAGSAAYFWARGKHNDAMADWNLGDKASARNLQSEAHNIVTLANIGLVSGGALVGLGAVLYLSAPSSQHNAVAAASSLSLRPDFQRGYSGLSVAGGW